MRPHSRRPVPALRRARARDLSPRDRRPSDSFSLSLPSSLSLSLHASPHLSPLEMPAIALGRLCDQSRPLDGVTHPMPHCSLGSAGHRPWPVCGLSGPPYGLSLNGRSLHDGFAEDALSPQPPSLENTIFRRDGMDLKERGPAPSLNPTSYTLHRCIPPFCTLPSSSPPPDARVRRWGGRGVGGDLAGGVAGLNVGS